MIINGGVREDIPTFPPHILLITFFGRLINLS